MRALILILFLFISSCTSLQNPKSYAIKYRQDIAAGSCEDAQDQIPLEMEDMQFLRAYKGSMGYIAYLTTVPITLTLDYLYALRCGQFGCPQPRPRKREAEETFPLTSNTYEFSKDMRCPDSRAQIQKYLEVSECFERRGDRSSLRQALMHLEYIEDRFDSIFTCVSFQDYHITMDSKIRVKKKLRTYPPAGSMYEVLPF